MPFAVLIAMPLAAAGAADDDADELAAGALELVLLLLPHAARINAKPTSAATLPERDFAVVRLVIILAPARCFT